MDFFKDRHERGYLGLKNAAILKIKTLWYVQKPALNAGVNHTGAEGNFNATDRTTAMIATGSEVGA